MTSHTRWDVRPVCQGVQCEPRSMSRTVACHATSCLMEQIKHMLCSSFGFQWLVQNGHRSPHTHTHINAILWALGGPTAWRNHGTFCRAMMKTLDHFRPHFQLPAVGRASRETQQRFISDKFSPQCFMINPEASDMNGLIFRSHAEIEEKWDNTVGNATDSPHAHYLMLRRGKIFI